MAKHIGVKPKRITHLGSSSNSNAKGRVDYVQDIINGMDSMKQFNQHAHYEKVLKTLKKKPEVVPNASENPPEYNIHGTKINKTVSNNKYHPLMAKCQKNLKYLQHNRSIPKPRAHIRRTSKSPLKKPPSQIALHLSSHENSLYKNVKIAQKKTSEAFKRSFPKAENNFTKSYQPAKKILKNTLQIPSNDSKPSSMALNHGLVSKKIKVKNRKDKKSCSLFSNNDFKLNCNDSNPAQLSEKDTDDDFESFVKRHKRKFSSKSTKCHRKKGEKSAILSSDEEDENGKTKLNCKKKRAFKSKCSRSEEPLLKNDLQSNNSHRVIESAESFSDEQVDRLNKVKCKKKKTCDLKSSQSRTATEKFKHHESPVATESSESESPEIYSNDICSDSSDECTDAAPKSLLKINAENKTNKSAELINKVGIVHDVHKGKELVTKDMTIHLVSGKNVILGEKTKSNQKPRENSASENVPSLISPCSVVIEQNDHIDKKAKMSHSKNSKNSATNEIRTVPVANNNNVIVANNDNVIEISDEEECDNVNQSDSVHDIKSSSENSAEPNQQLPNLNPDPKVQVEDVIKEVTSPSFETCTKGKRISENEDSDIEIVEIDAHEPAFRKHNQNVCISQDKIIDADALIVKPQNETNLLKVSAEQVNAECETEISINALKTVILENTKIQDSGEKSQFECTSSSVAIDNNEDEVTIIEAFSAEHKQDISKGNEHITADKEKKANKDSIISDRKECKDLGKLESGELRNSCSKSIVSESINKANTLDESHVSKTAVNSVKMTIPSSDALSESLNIHISDEDDCIILEPMPCVTQTQKEIIDITLENENSKSSIVSEFKTTEQNNAVKLSNLDCSPGNSLCKSVAKDLTSSNPSNQNENSSRINLSYKIQSKETQDLEDDCIILDDEPVKVLSDEKMKCNSSHEENAYKKLAENCDKSLDSVVVPQKAKASSSDTFKGLNQNDSCLKSETELFNISVCSANNIQSSNTIKAISDASINVAAQSKTFAENLTESLKQPTHSSPAQNTKISFKNENTKISVENECTKDESSFTHPRNVLVSSDNAYCNANSAPIDSAVKKVKCKVENKESSTVGNSTKCFEKLTELISNTELPFVNERVQYTNRHANSQNRLEIVKNASCDIDIKPCIYPHDHVSPTTDNYMSSNLNSSNEFKKKLQCNNTPNPALFHNDTSSILLSDKNLPSANSLKNVTLDSLNCLKILETDLHLSSINELDVFAESSIYKLSCTENKSILPLLNLYRNEVMHYQELRQTVKNVDAGIRTALEHQAERLKHLAFSIQNIVQNDPCFSNSFSEKCSHVTEHKQKEEYKLQDKLPYSSPEDLKKGHASKNYVSDLSSCSTSSALKGESSKKDQITVSNFCNESSLKFDNLPQLSLESLHENHSDCVENFEPAPIKSEPMYEIAENQPFEEEIKYSKSSEFQPEVIQDLKNSKCCVCNKPAIGACYFCCSVFYCSVECSESGFGKYHREACSKEYSGR